jgi:outer membrane protein assembly factor BamA
MTGRIRLTILLPLLFAIAVAPAFSQPKTRTEEIEQLRRDKMARLWPERQSPLVDEVNKLVERGLLSGTESGKGANGWQIVMGGMRSGQGVSVGAGYRRSDFWRDRLDWRATGRITPQLATMADFQLDFRSFQSERTFLNFYGKFEDSPQMDYYGRGMSTSVDDRTSYTYRTLNFDFNAGFEIFKNFRAGITGGVLGVHTGEGKRGGVPSTDEIYDSTTAPGLGEDTTFARWGGFVYYDYRDYREGPKAGGLYGARFRQHSDRELFKYSFKQAEFEFQQYIPYFNKTRTIAIRVAAVLSFPTEGNRVPFYSQPTIGGNDDLRGFARYRYTDDHSILISVEHRWYAFSGLDMAIFVDAGKTVPRKRLIDYHNLKYSGGIGFRARLANAVIMRIDMAYGDEGFRFMWTFSDIYKLRWK